MVNYKKMTDEEFDEILREFVNEKMFDIMSIPGVYEVCKEHFNNDVLDTWAERNPKKAYEQTVKCPMCNVLIGVENDDDTIECEECSQIFRVLFSDGKIEATEMLPDNDCEENENGITHFGVRKGN